MSPREAAYKSEYVEGFIYERTGRTLAHNLITTGIGSALHPKATGKEYGKTDKPRDRDDILQDEGLKPLKETHLRHGKEKEFARLFFSGDSLYTPQRLPRGNGYSRSWSSHKATRLLSKRSSATASS